MFRNSQKEDHGKHLEEVAGLKKENMQVRKLDNEIKQLTTRMERAAA